jgi:hypothetical protein
MSDAFQRDDEIPAQLLAPASAANTAAATSGNGFWIDLQPFEGDILVTQSVGAVTAGSITGRLQCADDANGTNAVDIAGAIFPLVNTANSVLSLSLNSKSTAKRFVGYVGTIVTGPALVGVTAHGVKKYN